ncbi:pyridoxal-phosphate-dependent aminotransferase family protein [Roseibacillus persicicus]|uniref:Aminotransferase n=1 Tax=Roseibacillus persicicus TaxID=454148 RepID=A0A918TTW3_9BACT|nr:alanine--glyoxylate aminotransferase family protein [Roseibacillus persicicus]MDQ8188730.1 alanine--glyoxylate aminotransferase family protein [Roseibacillus persicicus]GHC63164.1 aminotransferase [Roseibacillus persicicus]
MAKPKLFSPGPIDVAPETYAAMCGPTIGHRGADFEELYASVQPGLQEIAGTSRGVFLNTSSAWGIMEGSLRNLTQKKVLNLCGGAFSDKWYGVAKSCGKEAEKIQVEWGQPIDPADVRAKLSEGGFDTVTLVHNETSTGCMNNLAEIAAVVREFDDVLLITDTVSSFSAVPTPFDELGIDVLLCGVQKALALPPGLSLFVASERAQARAATTPDRGYYFDFVEFQTNHEKNNTPSTPAIPHIYGLKERVDVMLAEGLENRYARHAATNQALLDWAAGHGFESLAPEGFRSKSLGCFVTPDDLDLSGWIKAVRNNHGFLINGGYGKIKGKTFRISNMGNETLETMQELFVALDEELPKFRK